MHVKHVFATIAMHSHLHQIENLYGLLIRNSSAFLLPKNINKDVSDISWVCYHLMYILELTFHRSLLFLVAQFGFWVHMFSLPVCYLCYDYCGAIGPLLQDHPLSTVEVISQSSSTICVHVILSTLITTTAATICINIPAKYNHLLSMETATILVALIQWCKRQKGSCGRNIHNGVVRWGGSLRRLDRAQQNHSDCLFCAPPLDIPLMTWVHHWQM